ncbi:hypothetical protein PNEG_02922 [Pneumocystis murina B123]|uniref:m7GpppX diphosphatase n=1 Tax=Pneumocystis murina (strain B123) TaxID=1069680 RepID=M7PE54_PNEMU|nr:hypothetical protein PNEG_02922 [Pneumocystis murina B123]EMR08749.1 hypothetical protein PNEG_02922 [Pneumocystis murina B123]
MNDEYVKNIKNFVFESVLNEDSRLKYITLLGHIFDTKAILIIEKTTLELKDAMLFIEENGLFFELIEKNDIYHLFLGGIPFYDKKSPYAKITLIYPASEIHIKKYSRQSKCRVQETPEIYELYVKPYIETMKGPRIKWVYNILDHLAEKEHILYEYPDKENGFIIIPDLKWDQKTVSTLYYVAIVHRRDISSLRDLKKEHIPLLLHIKQAALDIIPKKFQEISQDQLKFFIHYHPSYYHFHVHISHIDFDSGDGMDVGRAYLLEDIINQLETMSDNFSFIQRTLTFFLGKKSDLWLNVFSSIMNTS